MCAFAIAETAAAPATENNDCALRDTNDQSSCGACCWRCETFRTTLSHHWSRQQENLDQLNRTRALDDMLPSGAIWFIAPWVKSNTTWACLPSTSTPQTAVSRCVHVATVRLRFLRRVEPTNALQGLRTGKGERNETKRNATLNSDTVAERTITVRQTDQAFTTPAYIVNSTVYSTEHICAK